MMIYSTHTWDFLQALESASPASARHQPHPLITFTQTIIYEETKIPEKRSSFQQMVWYCLGLHTQNPKLREVELEPSTKRVSDKTNRLRTGRKNTTENKS